jgi:hypothetical protein
VQAVPLVCLQLQSVVMKVQAKGCQLRSEHTAPWRSLCSPYRPTVETSILPLSAAIASIKGHATIKRPRFHQRLG